MTETFTSSSFSSWGSSSEGLSIDPTSEHNGNISDWADNFISITNNAIEIGGGGSWKFDLDLRGSNSWSNIPRSTTASKNDRASLISNGTSVLEIDTCSRGPRDELSTSKIDDRSHRKSYTLTSIRDGSSRTFQERG